MARCVLKSFGPCRAQRRECYRADRGFRRVPTIRVWTSCKRTESLAKVKIAVLNVFPDVQFTREGDTVEAVGDSISRLRDRIYNQKIRDAARSVFLTGRSGSTIRFRLNKQAAYAGGVSFAPETAPLGDLEVEIEAEDIDHLIDDIAESTTGRPPEALR